ncbi:DUF4158 domain-containing protein [Streptomyces sp. NPDC002133]|uniref:DUF4158 domain-containing protein n=1 Tax=Streptomyces sp. NPDC002133 TaxID=3154409 RepID=UPI003325CDC0
MGDRLHRECAGTAEGPAGLVSGKRGATRPGFAVLLKFSTQYGRFPRGRAELSGGVVEFVARQVQVSASELDSHEWTGRTVECRRVQIREASASGSAASRTRRS